MILVNEKVYVVMDKALLWFMIVDRMRGSRKFCQRGSKFDNAFFVIIGPPAKRHLNGVSLAGR